MKKGIVANFKGNRTLSGKQKKMPGSVPAPKFKPRDRKAGNKFVAKKSSKA